MGKLEKFYQISLATSRFTRNILTSISILNLITAISLSFTAMLLMYLLGQVSANLLTYSSSQAYNTRLESVVSFRLENVQDPIRSYIEKS
jgi:hypothetical protein